MSKIIPPVRRAALLVGQCFPGAKKNASKIKVKRLHFDNRLYMFFPHEEFYYVTDPQKRLKTGDIVLIKPLAEKITPLITHEIVTLIHEYGDITDPITGKKVVIDQYRDDIDEKNEMYGKLDSTFDYKKAPPRGWQEGKRDFTDKPTFRKWQVFPEDDPYGVY